MLVWKALESLCWLLQNVPTLNKTFWFDLIWFDLIVKWLPVSVTVTEWTQNRNLFNSKPISKKFLQHYSLSFHDWFLFRSKRNNLVPDVKVTINVRMKTVLPTSIAFIYFRFVFSHEEITPINLLQAVSLIRDKKRQEVTRSIKNRQEATRSNKKRQE